MNKPPDALLACAACGRSTRHFFAHAEAVLRRGLSPVEHRAIYRCSVCGEERTFGTAPPHGVWSTRDELAFVHRLRALGRGPLLVGYRQGLDLRRVWVGLDRDEVLLAADDAVRAQIAPLRGSA